LVLNHLLKQYDAYMGAYVHYWGENSRCLYFNLSQLNPAISFKLMSIYLGLIPETDTLLVWALL
jgi:hypothetical protein